MGIYDREYYRREGPSFLETMASHGKVCKTLILINVVIYVFQLLTMPRSPVTDALLLDVNKVADGQVWRLLTYAFLHSETSVYHILFNMLFLWWFGSDVEDVYGPREFLTIYLLAAIAGGVAFALSYWVGLTDSPRCLGASGAVTGVLVICAFHFPTRRILLFFILPVPIWAFVLFSVAQDTFGLLGGRAAENVAFAGHLGGAAFGAAYFWWGGRLLSFLPDFRAWSKERSRPKLRVYREEESAPRPVPVAAASAPAAEMDEQLDAKLDAVLAKITASGLGSLTEPERALLNKASEAARKRRS